MRFLNLFREGKTRLLPAPGGVIRCRACNASLAQAHLAVAAADVVVVLLPTLTGRIPPRSHRSKNIETGASSREDCLILQVALWRNAPRDSNISIYLALGCHETEKACRILVVQKNNLG